MFSLRSITPRCTLWVLQGHHICFSVPENPQTERWFATSIKCCSEVQSFAFKGKKGWEIHKLSSGPASKCSVPIFHIRPAERWGIVGLFFVTESTAWDLYVWNFPDCNLFDNNGEICLFSCSVPTVIKDLDSFLLVSHIVSDGKKV